MDFIYHYRSPLGDMTMASNGTALTGVWFDHQQHYASTVGKDATLRKLPVFEMTEQWLNGYFRGIVPDFTPPLEIRGTTFRRDVWSVIQEIPYGQTTTYKEIASRIAAKHGLRSMSAQAVGGAVGHNPLAIIIPCHRVVGSDGSLTGYAGGTTLKSKLLALEQSRTAL